MTTVQVGALYVGLSGSTVRVAELYVHGAVGSTVQVAELYINGIAVTAAAGDDRYVEPGETITLYGTGNGTPTWTQTGGPSAGLVQTGFTATYTAPRLAAGTSLTFQLSVTDGVTTVTDSVVHTVQRQQVWRLTGGVLVPAQLYVYF